MHAFDDHIGAQIEPENGGAAPQRPLLRLDPTRLENTGQRVGNTEKDIYQIPNQNSKSQIPNFPNKSEISVFIN